MPAPTVARILSGVARRLDLVAAKLANASEGAAPPAESADGPRDSAHAYGDLWAPVDSNHAKQLIFNETDQELFDDGGRKTGDHMAQLAGPEATVLDLGCGIGRVAKHVAPSVKSVWAVDASPRMLEFAREYMHGLANVRYARCLGTTMPDVPSGSVDFAYSLLVLQHLEREDAFALLRDVRRVLADDGSAFFTFPNLLSDVYLNGFVEYVEKGETANPVRARFYTPQEVERLLPVAGFEITRFEPGDEIVVYARPA